MPFMIDFAARISGLASVALLAAALAGCGEEPGNLTSRADQPLPPDVLALMQDKGTTEEAPMLIRAYKKEAEFEIWKMKADGHYTLLKTYPMCRWSGQLGPKVREGDRQVPEGFYTIAPAQMNPNSNYYLSFNVGYPNAYDRAHGHSGESIMVHGACSSAGCFSMTDRQIAEIYSIAREAFAGGQRAIQMQSLPFHMTPENLAKYRLDPNIDFWKELKTGSDNFEVTGQEVAVGVCNGRYVFNAEAADGRAFDSTGPCPALKRDQLVEDEVLAKQKRDDAKVAELIAEGVQPVHTVYADGGQNPSFSTVSLTTEVSRPDALAQGPVDVAVDGKTPTHAQLAAAEAKDLAEADAAEKKAAELRSAQAPADVPAQAPAQAVADVPQQSANPAPANADQSASGGSILTRLFGAGSQPQASAPAPTQTVAEQPQTLDPAAGGNGVGLAQFYNETQPTPQPTPPVVDQTVTGSTDSDEAQSIAKVPPLRLRKEAHARTPAPKVSKLAKSAPPQSQQQDTAAQPAPPAQTQNPPDNVFGVLAPIIPPGFAATPAH
jgi:murein L,D-transpeptidase YafK